MTHPVMAEEEVPDLVSSSVASSEADDEENYNWVDTRALGDLQARAKEAATALLSQMIMPSQEDEYTDESEQHHVSRLGLLPMQLVLNTACVAIAPEKESNQHVASKDMNQDKPAPSVFLRLQ